MPHDAKRDMQKAKDVLNAIHLIQTFITNETLPGFIKSDLLQSAVIRQLEIIGEAGNKISGTTRAGFPDVPWHSIKSFRNLLIHEYFKVDAAEVWTTVQNDLPMLAEQMENILSFLEKE